MSYIYKIINDINDKVYVGKTDFSIEKRFKEHCADAFRERNEKRPLYSAMRKYGVEYFHVELIEETDNPEEREIYWIDYFDGFTSGYNATKGGDGKRLYDHEAIVARLKEHPYPCDVAKEFGCCKDLVYALGKENNIVAQHKSNEKMKELLSKTISAYTKQGDFVKNFSSTVEAASWCFEQHKCATLNSGVRSHIAECANGKRKSAYGYIWKYENISSELIQAQRRLSSL